MTHSRLYLSNLENSREFVANVKLITKRKKKNTGSSVGILPASTGTTELRGDSEAPGGARLA